MELGCIELHGKRSAKVELYQKNGLALFIVPDDQFALLMEHILEKKGVDGE